MPVDEAQLLALDKEVAAEASAKFEKEKFGSQVRRQGLAADCSGL